MRASGDRLVARLAAMPGDVLVMMHPFYAYEAGKPPAAQIQALWHARWRGRDPLPADFVARIQNRDYSAIISDQSPYFETEPALLALIDANYVLSETLGIAGLADDDERPDRSPQGDLCAALMFRSFHSGNPALPLRPLMHKTTEAHCNANSLRSERDCVDFATSLQVHRPPSTVILQ